MCVWVIAVYMCWGAVLVHVMGANRRLCVWEESKSSIKRQYQFSTHLSRSTSFALFSPFFRRFREHFRVALHEMLKIFRFCSIKATMNLIKMLHSSFCCCWIFHNGNGLIPGFTISFRISSIQPKSHTNTIQYKSRMFSTHTVRRFYCRIDFKEFARLPRLHCRPFVGPFYKKPIRRPFLFDHWMAVDCDCANHLASTQTSRRAFYSHAMISSARELFQLDSVKMETPLRRLNFKYELRATAFPVGRALDFPSGDRFPE